MAKSKLLKKIWHFIWEEDSLLSWIVNIVLAFIIIKFLVYPGLGLLLGTNFPIVAVVSSSMEHRGQGFDSWWETNQAWYLSRNITKEEFESYPFKNGFNKGDIIVLRGGKPEQATLGKVMVFWSYRQKPKADPIIHRIVSISSDGTGYTFQTKGDNNNNPAQLSGCYCVDSRLSQFVWTDIKSVKNIEVCTECIVETDIKEEQVLGYALFKVPYLGYIKIWAFDIFNWIAGGIRNVLP